MKRLFPLFALACATLAAAADVYKWTDKDGIVHYSDEQPPADVKAERVPIAGMAKKAAAGGGAAANDADEAATPPAAAQQPVVTAALLEEKRCDQARKNLEVLQSSQPVGLDNGKAEPMSEKARAERITVEQKAIADYCK